MQWAVDAYALVFAGLLITWGCWAAGTVGSCASSPLRAVGTPSYIRHFAIDSILRGIAP